ncbi:MAG: hypothetical protein UW62_C0008G0008, partial [Candidatus Collierbacteria bacterium GW2011_GWB1_44_35]
FSTDESKERSIKKPPDEPEVGNNKLF